MSADNEFLIHVAEMCERASKGDLEARVLNIPESGEMHRIGNAINYLLDVSDAYVRETMAAMDHCSRNLFHRPILERGLPGSYADAARVINGAAGKMKGDAADLKQFEEQRERVANEVATATSAVAAACEELNATTSEIKGQLGHAVNMTHQAVSESNSSVVAIQQLGEAARRIESVVSLIARIARHTNLLALNATIEAARAGEHGAGFAVVANEVKALSQDTAKATEDISRTVEEMIKATTQVTGAIETIGTSVKDVDKNASVILISLDEQVKATAEIANRINAVANQTRELNVRS
jgi:methyl-accepting chemotaxis protein